MNLPEKITAGETLHDVQICPFGSFPNGKTEQLCDHDAFANVVTNATREVLCDFEHRSEIDKVDSDTSAAAWISNVRVDGERGLVGDFKFTDIGAEAVSQRRLRFLSPVWTLDKDGRPERLLSVALTNKPNIPVACVLNRAQPATINPVEVKDEQMDKLKELLGLASEATEEDILAAVTELKDKLAACNKEKEEAEAEAFAEEHKTCCNKDTLKAAYLMNKEAAKAMAAGFVKPEAPAPQKILNKDTPAKPAVKLLNKADARAEMASLPPSERAAFYKAHRGEIE